MFGSHTPCLSCLAVIAQFAGLFPNLKLRVGFDDWRVTLWEASHDEPLPLLSGRAQAKNMAGAPRS